MPGTILIIAIKDDDSTSFDLGYIVGVKEAKISGKLPTCDIESMALLSWRRATQTMNLAIVAYCHGYIAGYLGYLDGIT